MFGYFPVGVIVFCCYVIVFFGRKNRHDKVFSGCLFALIFKQFVRNLSKNSFCMEKDNVSISFTFSGLCFLSDSFKLIELTFVTTYANLNYLIDKVKT